MMQSTRKLPHVLWSTGLLRRSCVPSIQRWSAARYSESPKLTVSHDDSSGIAVMTMVNKPANLFDLDYLTVINKTMDTLHADKSCRGLILTSGLPGIFSGGLQIAEIYLPKRERFSLFWSMLQDVMLKIYGSRLATVAAINGHAPAGACMMAMSCDYRIMASGNYRIGFNDTQLGSLPPSWFEELMIEKIGQRQSERALQLGTLFPVEKALKVGLVDEVCEQGELLDRAKDELQTWLKVSDYARYATKLHMRQPLIDRLRSRKQEDIESNLTDTDIPEVQIPMGIYLDNLKNRKKNRPK